MSALTENFQKAIELIDTKALDVVGLINQSDSLSGQGEPNLAITLYKYWLLANPEHPLRHVPAFNLGCLLVNSGNSKSAVDVLAKTVAETPDFYPARLNLASAYERMGNIDAALGELNQILEKLAPVNAANIGFKAQALRNVARLERNAVVGLAALKQAVENDATQTEMLQHWVNRRQGGILWPVIEPVGGLTVSEVYQRLAPLTLASNIDDPQLQLAAAKRYSRQMDKTKPPFRTLGQWPTPVAEIQGRRKIGYLSSDFCNHAVGYLMADVFENHDRDTYEITVFNIGPTSNDALQQKIRGQVDRWFDLTGLSDRDAARLIVREGCDILLDMNGHTNHQRTGVLALKPAPVIANWLGYPGTMGSGCHHYVLADDFIIPPSHAAFYSEHVLRLPCYQPNGMLYQVPPATETRAELGLPETGVVFCCFNGSVKISEPVFARWMIIMNNVPGSVLWLRGKAEDDHAQRLKQEAARRGVAPERILFLSFRANTEYLGCHRYADLFLDTFPYGAHTTASDALRMGVPIVTLAGLSFASRVCGSLTRSAGIPELVCEDPDSYVRLAIDLGNSPEKLAAVKQKLQLSLPGSTLFDAPKLVRHLEGLFVQMWRAYEEGTLHSPKVGDMDPDEILPVLARGRCPDFISLALYRDAIAPAD